MSDCCPVTVSPLVAWPHADWLALAGVGRWWWHVPSGAARYDAGWKRQVGLPERAQIDTVTAWRERLHPDDVSEVDSQLAAVLRPGGRDRYEAVFRLRHADGDYRWIHSGGRVASRDETGAAQWLVGTHQDVTREMQQARIAQRDEAWLQALDQVVGGFRFVIVYRPDGSIQRIERISDSVVTLCGLTPETLIAAPERLWEYVLPQDRERIAQTVCDTIQARGTVLRIDYRMDRGTADATAPRWMRAVAIGEYMGEDGLSRWYGCALDITESVEQSERLATALNDLDATLKAIPDLCFVIDEQGYYRQVWAPTPELLLVPPAQIVGKRPRDVLPPALLGLVESGMAHAKDSGAPQEIRYTLRLGERLHHFEARIVVRQHGPHFGGYVCLVRDVTDLAQAQNEREQLLLRDRLTGHWNRAGLFDRGFAEWVSQHERGGGPLEILIVMADIDGLRELNHALGHAAGDRLIQTVAQRIADAAPAGLLARIGGDEIVLFAPARRDGDRARALPSDEVWVEQLQRGLSVPFFIDNLRYEPSVTLGWTRAWLPATNDFSTLLSSLLHQVESTMYTAKRRGRGSIERFDADRFAAQLQRQALARALPTALSQREFWLAFQPIVDPQTATLGYEALLRWRSSRFGEVSPADFIPLAEQSRAILGIGRWVLHEACSTMAQLVARQPAKACYVAVNVSAMQFLQPEFELDVQRALSASGLSADRLCLEVTESLLAEDLQIVSSKMQRLADQGVRFALDDFGTGYSNLLQLRTLPLDTLKIDRSFTRDILEDHEDALLVRSIIELAHRLHLQVVAEGVETSHQAAWLAEHHCDAMQGFYYGRPAPLLGGPPQR